MKKWALAFSSALIAISSLGIDAKASVAPPDPAPSTTPKDDYSLPSTTLQQISQWAGLFSGVFGTLQGAEWSIQTVASIASGKFNLLGDDTNTLILAAVQKIDADVLQLTQDVTSDFAASDIMAINRIQADKIASLETVIQNLFPPPGLPPSQIMLPSEMHSRLQDVANYVALPTAYQRAYVAGLDDGTVSASGSIPNSTLISRGGVPWKSIIPDRSPVGAGGSFGQVYDWSATVPFLIQVVTLELIAMSQLDPSFSATGAYSDILTRLLDGLQWNLAMMIDGVRCGYSTIGQGRPLNVGCADIYTGVNQTYAVEDPEWSTYHLQNDIVSAFDWSCNVNQSISSSLQMPYSTCNCVTNSGSGYPPIMQNVPSSWWSYFSQKVTIPAYVSGMSPDCDAQFDTYALQPGAVAARNAVLAQMPLASMRQLIGLVTQMLNPEPNQTAWESCLYARYYNAPSKAGDTGCKGTSDIRLVPTFGGWNTIPLAYAFPGMSKFWVWNNPTEDWPQANGNSGYFPQWAAQAQAVSGDFTGDGRFDVALVGGPGWWTIPVAHALGDGNNAVTNGNVGSHSYDCLLGFSGSSQCSHLGVDYRGIGLDFTAAASSPGVQAVSGDFDNDGFFDIALVGGAGWTTIPIAFSDGGGTFLNVTNYRVAFGSGFAAPTFPALAAQSGTKAISGDFNGDGYWDIALTNGLWTSVPIAFSKGDGTFRVVNATMGSPNFETYVQCSHNKVVSGDFDGDGRYDLAALACNGGIDVALSVGDGHFNVYPFVPVDSAVDMSVLAQSPVTTGDFDGDGRFDIAFNSLYGQDVYELLSLGMMPFGDVAQVFAGFGFADASLASYDTATDFAGWWNSSLPVRALGAF